jgi:hypothetical protein
MRLAAHSTTPPTPTAMRHSSIITLYSLFCRLDKAFPKLQSRLTFQMNFIKIKLKIFLTKLFYKIFGP